MPFLALIAASQGAPSHWLLLEASSHALVVHLLVLMFPVFPNKLD